jgi:hypothetical protein
MVKPSRLALIRSTTSGIGTFLIRDIATFGQVRTGKGVWQKAAKLAWTRIGVDQQARAARLKQQLTAPSARH